MILGRFGELIVKAFWVLDGLNSMFSVGLASRSLLHRFSHGIIDSRSFQNQFVVRKVLQKLCFRKNRSLMIRGLIFGVFCKSSGEFV